MGWSRTRRTEFILFKKIFLATACAAGGGATASSSWAGAHFEPARRRPAVVTAHSRVLSECSARLAQWVLAVGAAGRCRQVELTASGCPSKYKYYNAGRNVMTSQGLLRAASWSGLGRSLAGSRLTSRHHSCRALPSARSIRRDDTYPRTNMFVVTELCVRVCPASGGRPRDR